MTDSEKRFCRWCAEHDVHRFYTWSRWVQVRAMVLRMDRHECLNCREKYHRYRKADTVHHVNHFRRRPDVALEVWVVDERTGRRVRNLVSLCHDCHEEAHGFRRGQGKEVAPLTEERWD